MAGEKEGLQTADPRAREYFIGMKAGIRRFDKLRGASLAEPLPTKIRVNIQQSAPPSDTSAPGAGNQ